MLRNSIIVLSTAMLLATTATGSSARTVGGVGRTFNHFPTSPAPAKLSDHADRTNQGTITKGGQTCRIISVMVIGSDGKPHSTTHLECH